MPSFNLSGRIIGDEYPPVVIAEIGINHEGSIDTAIQMADAAIDSGAEVIKHQTHVVDDEMSEEAKKVIPGNAKVSIYDIMSKCALNEHDEYLLMQHIVSRGAIYLSTPFSRAAAERLARYDICGFKIGSGECNNYPLVKHIIKYGKPLIISTGMNTIESIMPTVEMIRKAKLPYALLHCTNIYPTPPEHVRFGAMLELKTYFPDAVIGLSDHTTTNYPCLGAVALGASIIERHFTDSMEREGPDIICSMDPGKLLELIEGANIIYKCRGGRKGPVEEELPTIAFAFASVIASEDLYPGDILSDINIWVSRPGGGDFSAQEYETLLGKKILLPLKKGSRLTFEHMGLKNVR